MKYATYTDKRGRKQRRLIKDSDSDLYAEYGIPAGPPDIDEIDWETVKTEINNVLFDNGAFTWRDAQSNQVSISGAMAVVKRHLVELYKREATKFK